MSVSPKVVPTTAFGRRFRSTTEARWAVFLTEAGIAWEYEAETYDFGPLGWYLPDFWLPGPEWFLEVKPGRTKMLDEDYDKAKALWSQARRPVVVVNGFGLPSEDAYPDVGPGWAYDIFGNDAWGQDDPIPIADIGGSPYRLLVKTCGCPGLMLRFELNGEYGVATCQQHDARPDWPKTHRAYEAAAAFRPGKR